MEVVNSPETLTISLASDYQVIWVPIRFQKPVNNSYLLWSSDYTFFALKPMIHMLLSTATLCFTKGNKNVSISQIEVLKGPMGAQIYLLWILCYWIAVLALYIWPCVASNGLVPFKAIAMCGLIWLNIALCNLVWSCMALHGLAWPFFFAFLWPSYGKVWSYKEGILWSFMAE